MSIRKNGEENKSMPLLNPPPLQAKTFKMEDIHSITLKSFQVSEGYWRDPVIKITTKKEVEEYNKNNPYVTITEYIEFNKNTGLFYIRKCTDEGQWKHCIPYGSYDTLKEAKVIVEFLEKHNWSKRDLQKRNDGEMWISDCYEYKSCIMCESTQLVNDDEHVTCQECGMKYNNDMKNNEWWLK